MIKVALFGAGRMGEAISHSINESDTVRLTELYEHPGYEHIGEKRFGVAIASDRDALNSDADVFVDFTEPTAAMSHFDLAVKLEKAIIVGTTGLSLSQLEEVRKAASLIPCLFAPNLSVGVNLLYDLASQAARTLPAEYDIEIIEMHHRYKIDRHSGTAIQLARLISSQGRSSPPIHSLRAGEIVGTHRVVIAGPGERLELVHEASSRTAFATGVVQAVRFLFGRTPGLYFVGDALGLR